MSYNTYMEKDSLAIVIPVYNEETCIEKVILDWNDHLKSLGIPNKIIVVDDGSLDNTQSILNSLTKDLPNLEILYQENQGHGTAIKMGYLHAIYSKTHYIFQTDSDNQFSPLDFEKLWSYRKKSNAIFGYRFERKDTFLRKMITFFMKKRVYENFEVNIPDPNIPYRLFESSFLKDLLSVLEPGLFAPNIFLSILSFKVDPNCPSVPVSHFDRENSSPKLVHWRLLKGCLKSFWDLTIFSYQIEKKLLFLKEKIKEREDKFKEPREFDIPVNSDKDAA